MISPFTCFFRLTEPPGGLRVHFLNLKIDNLRWNFKKIFRSGLFLNFNRTSALFVLFLWSSFAIVPRGG